jgi:DNA topoisomerase-1
VRDALSIGYPVRSGPTTTAPARACLAFAVRVFGGAPPVGGVAGLGGVCDVVTFAAFVTFAALVAWFRAAAARGRRFWWRAAGYPCRVTEVRSATPRRPRLRRSDCSDSGLRRVRRGRGFGYVDVDGERVSDERSLARIRALAIPPAWQEVWICVDPLGHLQATGIDAAGRKQYLYHEAWREQRDRQKFRRMIEFAEALPRLRRRLNEGLAGEEIDEVRVLACSVRLLDLGLFRIGGEEYAEQGGGLGLSTLHKDHVSLRDGAIVFDYPAKSGVRRVHEVRDPDSLEVIRALKRRRGGGPQLLAYRDGRRWTAVHSEDINDYIKRNLGDGFSAKDFRTWNATVMAAVSVSVAAGHDRAKTKTARKRVVDGAVRQVAELLGNTPAVARRAYIDPRVFDRYRAGSTISLPRAGVGALSDVDGRPRRRIERAVLGLLAE